MESSLNLHLTNCSIQRKIKPSQNLSLIILGLLWLFIVLLLPFNNHITRTIASYLIITSAIPLFSLILLSIPFLFIRKKSTATITKNHVIIDNIHYNLDEVTILVNIDQIELKKHPDNLIKKLPKWGNFLIINNNVKIEFIPTLSIKLFKNIEGYKKRPSLYIKTADLFNVIMSTLWGAS